LKGSWRKIATIAFKKSDSHHAITQSACQAVVNNGSGLPLPWLGPSQARINRLTLKRQYTEDALVDTAQGFVANETLQRLDPQGKFSQGQ